MNVPKRQFNSLLLALGIRCSSYNKLIIIMFQMKWAKPEGKALLLPKQTHGCSFFNGNQQDNSLFLIKKLTSPPKHYQMANIPHPQRQMRSPKQHHHKISLKTQKEKMKSRHSYEYSPLIQSIQAQRSLQDCASPMRPSQLRYSQQCFQKHYLSSPIKLKGSNRVQYEQNPYQHASEKCIRYLQFEPKVPAPIINFVKPINGVTESQTITTINRSQSNPQDFKINSEVNIQELFKSDKNQTTLMPSQTHSTTQLHTNRLNQCQNSTSINFQLPPKLHLFDDCQVIDNQLNPPQNTSAAGSDQLLMKSFATDQILNLPTQNQQISQSTKSDSLPNFAKNNGLHLQLQKSLQKQKTVQKMQDVEQIVSVCDSAASEEDDESIVLGRLQQFESMVRERPQMVAYEKGLSECDSIVIFQ